MPFYTHVYDTVRIWLELKIFIHVYSSDSSSFPHYQDTGFQRQHTYLDSVPLRLLSYSIS
jgi:hypothetical protein